MFVALSIGILTALTGTGISQVAPAFADKEECEDNGDNNCNERTHIIKQDDDCKAKNEYEKIGNMGTTTNNNDFVCTNVLTSPANGDDNVILGDDGVSNEPGNVLICHRPNGNPTQSQTLSLSQNAANSHLANHPFDTTGACPT
jgi:hypothetical protein